VNDFGEVNIVTAGDDVAGAITAIHTQRANPKLRVAHLDKSKQEAY